MSHFASGSEGDPVRYADAFDEWLSGRPPSLVRAATPTTSYSERVDATSALLQDLFDAGWARYGWPEEYGGLGGGIMHRAAMWEALARHGVSGMALYEHLEVLAPTLLALAPKELLSERLPLFIAGRERWAQGFSEPGAGSDLAAIRTRATRDGDDFVINGRKIWTSWAVYADWVLLLARTGPLEARHRSITAFAVDLRAPGVKVHSITQANGTDELAEVTFDDVRVPASAVVGALDGGWHVAMHILSHERGTFAWFRHCFLVQELRQTLGGDDSRGDHQLGDSILDLYAVTAASLNGLRVHHEGDLLGPRAAFTKLLLCQAERSVCDWMLAERPEISVDLDDPHLGAARQEYLFSRIVTVYGGSQQMQLHTIAKQILDLQ